MGDTRYTNNSQMQNLKDMERRMSYIDQMKQGASNSGFTTTHD
jgi:hypothetical protein